MQNCIKCFFFFAKRQDIITGFTSNTKQYIYMNEQNLRANRYNPEAHPPVHFSTLNFHLQAFTHSLRGNIKDVLLIQL